MSRYHPLNGRTLWRTNFLAVVCCLASTGVVRAEIPFLDFLHNLQKAGYGELARDYVLQIEQRSDLPVTIRNILELELGKSLLVASRETSYRSEAESYVADARKHLEHFHAEHPKDATAAEALVVLADLDLNRALSLIRQGRTRKEEPAKNPQFEEARTALEAARAKFLQAASSAPPPSTPPARPAEHKVMTASKEPAKPAAASKTKTKTNRTTTKVAAKNKEVEKEVEKEPEPTANPITPWLEARFKSALISYYMAQTYGDPNNAPKSSANEALRKKAWNAAAQDLDAIYQEQRSAANGITEIGLLAHMWHGKVMEELGDLVIAQDIYDEVLVNSPDKDQAISASMDSLFAQVEYFSLLIMLRKNNRDGFITEARDWLELHASSRHTAGYQGIAFELAKTLGAYAESTSGKKSQEAIKEALALTKNLASQPGDYHYEATLLRRKLQAKSGGASSDVKTFDEAEALANAAVTSNKPQDAIVHFTRALELAKSDKKISSDRILAVEFALARNQYLAGEIAKATQTAEAIARNHPADTTTAPAAAAFALNVTLHRLANATDASDKGDSAKSLTSIAEYLIKTWPGRAEADDARLAIGQMKLFNGQFAEGIVLFEAVPSVSERYAQALQLAGQGHWLCYAAESRKALNDRDASLMETHRKQAGRSLMKSRELQLKNLGVTVEAKAIRPEQLFETELLLAEILVESDKAVQALSILESLLEQSTTIAKEITKTRVQLATMKASLAVKDLDRARNAAKILMASGGDIPAVNSMLVEFCRLLGLKAKDNPSDQATKQQVGELLQQLVTRQNLSVAQMIFVGDACVENHLIVLARDQYDRVLKKANEDSSMLPTAVATRIRVQLIGLLRDEKRFDEALVQLDQLLKAHPNALEPLMQQGYILQEKAKSIPHSDGSAYTAAIQHWTALRLKLAKFQKKPPEFYQVIYNAAECLNEQSKHLDAESKAVKLVQAESLLKSTRILSPELSGPDMVAKYDMLLQSITSAKKALPVGVQEKEFAKKKSKV